MKNFITLTGALFLIFLTNAVAQNSLPLCKGPADKWNACNGVFSSGKSSYIGGFKNGEYDGYGTYVDQYGGVYVGEYKEGKFHGQGTYKYSNGGAYKGGFLGGVYHGYATFINSRGDTYIGEYDHGTKEGEGAQYFADGRLSMGEWHNNIPHGKFIEFGPNKEIKFSGTYANGAKKESKYIDPFSFKKIRFFETQLNALSENLSFTEKVNLVIGQLLDSWLQEGISKNPSEIVAPEFPPPLNLTQYNYESNKEFESRIERSREERRKEIELIQENYKKNVNARNIEVQRLARVRSEREAQLSAKKVEFLKAAFKESTLISIAKSANYDQESGVLFIEAAIGNGTSDKYEFKDLPQKIRRDALAEPSALMLKPEFFVSDSGQFGVKAINLESSGVKAIGVLSKSSANSQALRLATIDVPVSNLPVLTQQSAITVDKNQVEQILYRDENESLRKRLDEQRRSQELALAEQAKRVEQETAKYKAEADAAKRRQQELEAQLVQSSGNKTTINYGRTLNAHALVIGNSAYSGSAKLANPLNDAKSVSAKLRDLGFKVTEVVDADRAKLVSSLSGFAAKAQSADLTMLFYAGHGVQISGTNYMLPIDLNMNDLSQVPLQGVSLSSVVEQYLPGKTKLVFLDACRDNPLMQTASRSVSRGLAPINVSEGTLIAYSTKDGQVAQDGDGKNSPFTRALLDHLDDQDDIAVVLRKVREQVMKNTRGKQQPWEYGSLTGGSLVLSAIKQK